MLVDYATRYPEALPLCAATAKAVAKELMLLFSRVGIAREVLTDQGSCFMSRVMKELLSLLQVTPVAPDVGVSPPDGWPGGAVQQDPKTDAESYYPMSCSPCGRCSRPPPGFRHSSCSMGEGPGES